MADKKRMTIKELEALYQKEKSISEFKIENLEAELNSLSNVLDVKRRIAIQQEINNERQKILNAMQDAYVESIEDGYYIHKQTEDALKSRIKLQKDLLSNEEKIIKNNQKILALKDQIAKKVKSTWQYLMDSDKVIRSTILNLGMSVSKADEMRTSFELSAGYIARIGGNLGDIQTIMQEFANETGRARVLSSEMVNDIALIGKGTGLGIEQATKLTAQFELMGLNVREAMNYAEGVVETSELMGVNTTKVLKNITDNFEKLQKMTFQQGVKGFASMAQYAEKMKIDMGQALDSAQIARSLEGAIDLAAQLQVMGGEFAKTDPFQMLFLARNDPEEYTKKINEMTKGIVTFRKNAEGTFETFISPADIDRLTQIEKSLGLQSGELSKQARRMAEIQRMRQQMIGMGLTREEKTLIEGMATFVSDTGRFQVQIAGITKDISNLTRSEIEILNRQAKTLEERALAAQTFDDVYRATIQEFKTILLPLLKGVNKVLETIRPVVINITDFITELSKGQTGWLNVAGTLLGAAAAWKLAIQPLTGGLIDRITGKLGTISTRMRNVTAGGVTRRKTPTGIAGRGKTLGTGLGVGAAGLGVGGGIALAAEGISSLADAMSKLDESQAETLKSIVNTLGIASGIAAAAAVGVGLLAGAGIAAAPAMLAFGGAIALVGGGIGLAASGIGFMAEGFSKLISESKGAGPAMLDVGAGIAAISASLSNAIIGIPGAITISRTLKSIGKHAPELNNIGNAFNNINAVLSGSKDDLLAVEKAIISISNANLTNLNQFSKLNKLFSKPLQVEFADKEVNMVSNISLNIDGYKFIEKTNATTQIIENQKRMREGKMASGLFS